MPVGEAMRSEFRRWAISGLAASASVLMLLFFCVGAFWVPVRAAGHQWADVPAVKMLGDLKIFWNVKDVHDDAVARQGENARQAYARGFLPVTLIDPYANRAGGGKEHLHAMVSSSNSNPWVKPPNFERVIRQDFTFANAVGLYVTDIETVFELDARKGWAIPEVRKASGAVNFADFEVAYFREWATWWSLPMQWAKEKYPQSIHGLYGRQPFDRDYWGVAGKTTVEIEEKHKHDLLMWQVIEPHVDSYIVDIYNFYDKPDSIFYMASNVELNFQRARNISSKPIYVYEWLRYHESNVFELNRELDTYLVEAMAVIPYFSGAKGIVLWGYEVTLKPGDGHGYRQLPLFMRTLARVASLSDGISRGTLVIDEPAHVLWKARKPLVRRIDVKPGECIVLAVNPWQNDAAASSSDVACGGQTFRLEMAGRHATLAHISGGQVALH
jgi:hypothetical protein